MSDTARALPKLLPVRGVRIAVTELGGRPQPRADLALFELQPGTAVAAVFTKNAFRAAPVLVAIEHLHATASPRYWLVNAGNANAATGQTGIAAAQRSCELVAAISGCDPADVLPFSTGVIGEPLPIERFAAAIPKLAPALDEDHWLAAANAIRTTDTVAKGSSRRFEVEGVSCQMTAIAKGSGMIRPDMATMLAFIATDAACSQPILRQALEEAVETSFHRISVDGDTSTNDACVVAATGGSGAPRIESTDNIHYVALAQALADGCKDLALAIVGDGEGATKFVAIEVRDGANPAECLAVAYTIAHSPLVKTALFASDANWGRLVMAIGRAGVPTLDPSRVGLSINGVVIVHKGSRADTYVEADGSAAMAAKELHIVVDLGRGKATETVWTCDLSPEYVSINADYRS